MYLLDTNVVSLFDPRRRERLGGFADWLAERHDRLFLSVLTIGEIESGILKVQREGKVQRAAQIIALRYEILTSFADRILVVDVRVALETSRLIELVRPLVIEFVDLSIAATASVHDMTVVTTNSRHFRPTGVSLFDPREAGLLA
jgi:predicted nucleic acid-binding protein